MSSPNGRDKHFCWQEIGIAGDRSCEALSRYVHCRNCPEYSSRGRTLFDQEMPGDYRHDLSEELARAVSAEGEDAVSLLVFRVASEWFALRTLIFQEVAPDQKAYALPFRSGELLAGLVNVNGELLLSVSLAAALGIPVDEKAAPGGKPRLCVVRSGRERFAFAVDEILGVRRISAGRLQAVPATLAKSPSAQVASCFNLDNRLVGLIDEKRMFSSFDRSLRW
jgi:chemotaxis-related protein WspD